MKYIYVLFPLLALVITSSATAETADVLEKEEVLAQDVFEISEAEALPEDGFQFGWETAWFRIRRAFAFQAERKAELDRERLHALDRKLAACAELGDENCMERVENQMQKVEDRAERHLRRRQDVLERHKERFETRLMHKEERMEMLRQTAERQKSMQQQLLQERKESLRDLRQQRADHVKQMRAKNRGKNDAKMRQQNQEQLIEIRSQNLKDTLDAAREEVLMRQETLDQAVSE